MATASDTTRTPRAQQSRGMHAGPRMRQLMVDAESGTTAEEIAHDLAEETLHGIYAAAAICTAMLDGEPNTATLLGLQAVLTQARKTASALDEVLQDADQGERRYLAAETADA